MKIPSPPFFKGRDQFQSSFNPPFVKGGLGGFKRIFYVKDFEWKKGGNRDVEVKVARFDLRFISASLEGRPTSRCEADRSLYIYLNATGFKRHI